MASERQLVVKFIGDAKSLKTAGAEAEGSLGKLTSAAKVAAGAFAAGFVADQAVQFLEDSTKAAEEDKKSQALLATQLKTTTGATDAQIKSTEDFINKLSRQTGVMDDDLRPAFASLTRGTKDTEKAQSELAIAMDIAAARGVDLETVTTAMEKAHNGNIGALGRLGVATKDAEGNTLSLEAAMAGAAETYKGAAEAAVTPGQRMSVAFQELKEQVGSALLPVLENLSTFMADTLLPAFQNAIVWIQTNWPAIENAIRETFDKIKPWLDEFVHSIELAFDIIKGVFQVVSDLLHGHWSEAWRDFRDMIGNVVGDVGKLVGDKVDQVKTLLGGLVSWIEGLPEKMLNAASGMWDWIYSGFKAAWDKLADIWNGLEITLPKFHVLGTNIDIGGNTIGFPDLPHLAQGGIVSRPTLALIGEHGPEAVIPLGRGGMGGGGVNIYGPVTVVANDPATLVRQLQTYDRQNGGVPISTRVPA
jgi:hypothetical protein